MHKLYHKQLAIILYKDINICGADTVHDVQSIPLLSRRINLLLLRLMYVFLCYGAVLWKLNFPQGAYLFINKVSLSVSPSG